MCKESGLLVDHNEPELTVDLHTGTDLGEGCAPESCSHFHQSKTLSHNQRWSSKELMIPEVTSFT